MEYTFIKWDGDDCNYMEKLAMYQKNGRLELWVIYIIRDEFFGKEDSLILSVYCTSDVINGLEELRDAFMSIYVRQFIDAFCKNEHHLRDVDIFRKTLWRRAACLHVDGITCHEKQGSYRQDMEKIGSEYKNEID